MRVVIVGGGKTGSFVAEQLKDENLSLLIIDKNEEVVRKLNAKGFYAVKGDACDPSVLQKLNIEKADCAAVVTGHDEDNLVISHLLKRIFEVKRIIARVNNPLNEWLFGEQWGVDISVSSTHIISDLILEEIKAGKIIELLRIKAGSIAVVETTLGSDSKIVGKELRDIKLPPNALIVTVVRDDRIMIPDGKFVFEPQDEIHAIVPIEFEKELSEILT
jgi:trk system potassium uptake protein TrkA